MSKSVDRRLFLLGSAACITETLLFRSARGETLPSGTTPPTIDALSIKVLMDSSHDIFLRAPTPAAVKIKRFTWPTAWPNNLHSQWGLSLALESHAGAQTRRAMLDFGYQPEPLMANMELLGVDPAKFEAIILSHGHFDHYGGLVGFLRKYRDSMRPDLTLYVGGEDNFCERKLPTATPGHFTDFGRLDRREVAAERVTVVMCEKPTLIAGHAFTTGTIARSGFEKVLPNTLVIYGKQGDVGCDASAFPGREVGKPVPDEHVHEHATCYNLKDRGLVVITSCGHVGIINTVRQAMAVSGVAKLHALVGGFHLAVADDAYLKESMVALKALNPDVVIPMHCSGINFIEAMREQMPDRLALSTNGTEFLLGA
jgi:7,8-dihydropterin-6-yl-methyl-4-(beta-D-ribofuranosyl)aminobenzene 5'-phosphate synthase